MHHEPECDINICALQMLIHYTLLIFVSGGNIPYNSYLRAWVFEYVQMKYGEGYTGILQQRESAQLPNNTVSFQKIGYTSIKIYCESGVRSTSVDFVLYKACSNIRYCYNVTRLCEMLFDTH